MTRQGYSVSQFSPTADTESGFQRCLYNSVVILFPTYQVYVWIPGLATYLEMTNLNYVVQIYICITAVSVEVVGGIRQPKTWPPKNQKLKNIFWLFYIKLKISNEEKSSSTVCPVLVGKCLFLQNPEFGKHCLFWGQQICSFWCVLFSFCVIKTTWKIWLQVDKKYICLFLSPWQPSLEAQQLAARPWSPCSWADLSEPARPHIAYSWIGPPVDAHKN